MHRPSRKFRFLTVLIALCGMLFMRFAVASYACPGLSLGDTAVVSSAAALDAAAMPDCEQRGGSNAALCHAHCTDSKSSLDEHQLRVLAAPAVLFACVVPAPELSAPHRQALAEPLFLLQRSTAPPIAIRHCCFRI